MEEDPTIGAAYVMPSIDIKQIQRSFTKLPVCLSEEVYILISKY